MPTYEYRCPECDCRFERTRPVSEASQDAECPSCGADARRAFSPVGVVFKGSGFHSTDYRDRPKELPAKTSQDTAAPDAPCSAASSGDSASCEGCPKAG